MALAEMNDTTVTHATDDPASLSMKERAVSVVLGLGLAAAAVQRADKPIGLVALLAGGYLAWRGATGTCPVKGAITRVA